MRRTSSGNSLPRPPVHRILLAEFGLLVVLALPVCMLDAVAGRSVLLGGLIFLVPQSWFAWRVFRARGAKAAFEVVQDFYRGEVGKFMLVSVAFALVFVCVRPLNPAALFGTYVALHIVNTVLLIRFKHA